MNKPKVEMPEMPKMRDIKEFWSEDEILWLIDISERVNKIKSLFAGTDGFKAWYKEQPDSLKVYYHIGMTLKQLREASKTASRSDLFDERGNFKG